MKQLEVMIMQNEWVAPNFYKMRIKSAYLAANIRPGQFLEVKSSSGLDPFLRRPIGCHRVVKNCVEMLYEVVGKGTEALSLKKKGEYLSVVGPLGNGFSIISSPKTAMIVAGGIGVAPLVALAEALRKKKNKVCAIIGARTKSHVLCEKEFKSLRCAVKIVTEDGSKGCKGLATDVLMSTLSTGSRNLSAIYACGPTGMLKTVAQLAKAKEIPCQISLEERIACGVGVCLGCPIRVRKTLTDFEYKMVCKDGPIFRAEDIAW